MPEHRRRSPLPAALLVLAVFAGHASAARAQSPTTGAVTGVVQSAAGGAIREALVTLRDTAAGIERTVITPRDGQFAFRFLAPGEYDLFVESIGFAPRRLTGIRVRPEYVLTIRAELDPAEQPGGGDLRRVPSAVPGAARPGAGQWIPEFAIRALPARERTLGELTRLASSADEEAAVEGLPVSLSTLVLDGVPFRPAAGPPARAGRAWANAFALSAAHTAQLITNGVDVAWSDAAAAFLNIQTRTGTERPRGDLSGYWSGSALPAGSSVHEGADSFNDAQGGFVLRGPAGTDRARFTIGVEAHQLETPLSSAWPAGAAADAAVDAASAGGVDLTPYSDPGITRHRAVSGFARLDASLTDTHGIEAAAQFATIPGSDDLLPGTLTSSAGTDLVAGATVRSSFGADRDNELRLSVTRTRREGAGADSVPRTLLTAEGLGFGEESVAYSATETLIRIGDAVYYRTGQHALKVGAGFTYGRFRYDDPPAAPGAYAFGSADQLSAGTGAFSRTEGPAAFADWSNRTLSAFVQDRWSPASGLDVTIGVRADRESLPSNVQRDADWFQLTGLANDEVGDGSWRIAPRIGVTWSPGRTLDWLFQATAGLYFDRFDPLLIAQWQTDDGTNRVRRSVGAVTWPVIEPAAGTAAPRLTMLSRDFDAPRTARVSAGVTRRIGQAAVHVGAVFRRTENLPRRSDLNLLQLPAFTDQHGRAVYGTLAKQGGLLVAEPGSSRRFTEYDEVAALSADGWSEHFGVTVGAERELSGAVGLLARYTYGRTEDNWFDAARGGWSMSSPAGLDDWSEGTSDFDRPHRAVVGLVADVLGPVRVAALYRMQSGRPFTPGFRPGVDANADDAAGNDPAFVDPELPGMDALMSEWSCVRESAGAFAERNSCRTEPTNGLDLSLGIRLFRLGSGSASLSADAFDVLESMQKYPDTALYLVDPGADLVTDTGTRIVSVPLLVNPDFGESVIGRQTGRRIRLGISLNW